MFFVEKHLANNTNNAKLAKHINTVFTQLNDEIKEDTSNLGKGFCLGHSYFCTKSELTTDIYNDIIETEVAPLLQEYWFDNPKKANQKSAALYYQPPKSKS